MLDLFRNRGLTSFVYGFIIIATIAVFVIQFRPNAGQKTASLKQACVAKVRGYCIEPKDHKALYRILLVDPQTGEARTARAKQMGLNRIAMDALIERELLIDEADRLGLQVSEQEVTDSIFDGQMFISLPSDRPELRNQFLVLNGKVPAQYYGGFRDPKTQTFDLKMYERVVRNLTGRSAAEFRTEQSREILASRMRNLIRSSVRISESEAFDSYMRENTKATLDHVLIKPTFAARYLVSHVPSDIEAWAKEKANSDLIESTLKAEKEDTKPQAGHIRHILIRVAPNAAEGEKREALEKLADAVRRVQSGERFAEVAREVSNDYGSASKGGDVGDKTDGFVGPFRKAADALKPGEMTPSAIQTQFGYHILLKDDPESLRRDVTRALYFKTKSLDSAKNLATRIREEAKSGKPLEEAVSTVLTPIFKRSPVLPPLRSVALDPEPDADGGAPTAAASDGGTPAKAVALAAKEVSAETDSCRPRAETSPPFNPSGDPLPEIGSDASQKVTQFAFTAKAGDLSDEPLRTDTGFLVVRLKERKSASEQDFSKEKETYTQELLTRKQTEELALYTKRLRENAKPEIKIDEQLLQEPGTKKDGGAPLPEDFEEE